MGSVYVPPDTSSGSSGSSGTNAYNQKYIYLSSYFPAHMLSTPSHRYAYLMWFAFVGFALLASALHHLGIGDRTWLGAFWSKFAPKSRLVKFGKKSDPATIQTNSRERPGQASGLHSYPPAHFAQPRNRPPPKRYVFTFPSFGKIILVLVMVTIPVVLTLVGADYINPSAGMFDLSYSWPSASVARYGASSRRSIQNHLQKRMEWGIGSFTPVTTAAPTYSLPYHTWWTAGGRTGLMTNAMTPFVVILALKQVPWAVMSTKLFGRHSFEKLSFLHKWGGRLVFAYAAAHTITWSIQLHKDQQFGTDMWGFVFIWVRFRWAFVAMGFLTLLTILSIGPIRTHYYEWFYVGHIICAIGFMVATALHHPPLAGWMWASLTWWGAERVTRALKVAYINGIGFAGRKPQATVSNSGRSSLEYQHGSGNSKHTFGHSSGHPSYSSGAPDRTPFEKSHSYSESHHSHGHHTQSSATLYEPSLASQSHSGHRAMGSKGNTLSPPGRAAFLPHDPHQGGRLAPPGGEQEDEWELDENGETVRRRPSRRYGPVSDLIKEYAARPMSGIEEDGPYDSGTGSAESAHHAASDIGASGMFKPMRYEEVPLQPLKSVADPYDGSSAGHYAPPQRPHDLRDMPPSPGFPQSPLPMMRPQRKTGPRAALPADVAALIKPGYAFAQILPGKTLRLTLRTPNRMSWKPGQWVNLNAPVVQGWQSHPFTIASAHDADLPLPDSDRGRNVDSDVEKGLRKERRKRGEERTMVLLIRARKGFTLKLYNYVRKNRHRQVLAAASHANGDMDAQMHDPAARKTTTGVHIRAIIDGAYGSTERVRWGIHSTVVIVCGGSGVSFGMAVLEHLCACLQEKNAYGQTARGGKAFAVRRIRFIWICREFSHLQWVASSLRRCIEMVPPEQLQIDLFVTHFNNQMAMGPAPWAARQSSAGDLLAGSRPPTPGSAGLWKDAHGNVHGPSQAMPPVAGPEAEEIQMDANGFTEFDGEDMAEPSAAEMEINSRIRKEGKLRRAHTRKATPKRKPGRGAADGEGGGVPRLRETVAMAAQRAMYEGNARNTLYDPSGEHDGLPGQDHQDHLPNEGGPRQDSRRARSGSRGAMGGFISRDPSPMNMRGEDGGRPRMPQHQASQSSSGFLSPRPPLGAQTPSGAGTPQPWTHSEAPTPGDMTPTRMYSPMDWDARSRHGPAGSTDTAYMNRNSYAHRSHSRLLPDAAAVAAAADEAVDYLDCPIDLDEEEEVDLKIIAELAQSGHPRLDRIIAEECHRAQGRVLVASCGPANLSALLRRIVAKHVDPKRVRQGDLSAHINLCMESFDWGGS